MTRVLVTGGAGYIGSHTAVELAGAGCEVVIADNLSNSEFSAVEGVRRIVALEAEARGIEAPEVPFVEVDCIDKRAFEEVFRRWKFDAVIHFAAYKAVGESVAKPLKYYRGNVGSFLTLLELMNEYDVRNVVFSSSATVYGEAEILPVTEQTPHRTATSPYGETKQICENILRDTVVAAAALSAANPKGCDNATIDSKVTQKSLHGISLRYFNPIGAHPSALIGELPKGVPGNLVPFIAQCAAQNIYAHSDYAEKVAGLPSRLLIFGDDYPTPDGTARRDYIDIVDLARAHVVAVQRMTDSRQRTPYEIFNIGTGKPVSVMELVRTFESVNNLKLNYEIAPRRPGDIADIWADTSLAQRELGWRATRPLEDILRSAWAWERRIRGLA